MYSLLVGIDVSKDVFSTAGINSGGKESFSETYSMDSNGFEGLLKTIRFDCEDLSKVIVAMESTGCYHINPESGVKTMDQIFNLSIFLMAYSNASLYRKLAGSFKVGLLSGLISSPGITSSRALRVLSVIL